MRVKESSPVLVAIKLTHECRGGIYNRTSNSAGTAVGVGLLIEQVTETYWLNADDLVVFIDPSCTSTQHRPAFEKLLRAIRNGQIDRLFLSSLSQLHRNRSELLTFASELVKHGGRLISVNEIEVVENASDLQRLADRLGATAHLNGSGKRITTTTDSPCSSTLGMSTTIA